MSLPSPEQVKRDQEFRKGFLEEHRDKRVEQALKDFTKVITDKESVPPPEIIAVPGNVVFQVSEGMTKIATYRPVEEIIYINSENPLMFNVLHEAKHHVDYKKRGIAHLMEGLKCREEGIPYEACPNEKRAHRFAVENVVEYIDEWKEKVEPIVGKRKIFPPIEKL